jgi:hypothetical protein
VVSVLAEGKLLAVTQPDSVERVNVRSFVIGVKLDSETVMLKLWVPIMFGIPLRTPLELSESQVGKVLSALRA